jgi:hypothetical protein
LCHTLSFLKEFRIKRMRRREEEEDKGKKRRIRGRRRG